eukprot:scaffold23786_cov129-Isochrysis_galbana.AAC.1
MAAVAQAPPPACCCICTILSESALPARRAPPFRAASECLALGWPQTQAPKVSAVMSTLYARHADEPAGPPKPGVD